MLRALLLVVLFEVVASEMINNVRNQKELYEMYLNSSIRLDREDKALMNSWTVEFQVKRVNITTKYRMQMARHKEHSFRRIDHNGKWTECVFLHHRQIRKAEKDYYENESECLTFATAEDKERILAVEQMGKEIRKWRKGYRYLVNTCKADNPNDETAADSCLIQYMEKDSYNKVIQRLIILKLEAMGQLYLQLNNSLKDLEECLQTQLSTYLEQVRLIMGTLNKCYGFNTQDNGNETNDNLKMVRQTIRLEKKKLDN